MDFVSAFNVVEAVWWIVLAAVVGRARRYPLAAAFFAFGLSDLIEVWSGAWWRPWWLAGLKAACVLAVGILSWRWYRETRRTRP